ncbi:MAG TPA: heavy metal translocating P-type ATPase [Steroidobacteraceae bacterium]|nr:heavy metal translocating P-type ATPase [Steroidobacteraceae bacterium]
MPVAVRQCFHCSEPLAGRSLTWARVRGEEVPVCCPGCRAAAELIDQLGLADYYRFRTAPGTRPADNSDEWAAYADPRLEESLTRREADGRAAIVLIDGLTCAACNWLITRALQQKPGVLRASVNAATGRALIVWDEARIDLARVLATIAALGYRPHVVTGGGLEERARSERRAHLKRLGIAGLGMMQVMSFAVPLYSGDANGMGEAVRSYLQIVSMLVATPVLFYSGWPFLKGAYRALIARGVTMDVPVSLGLLLAYSASVWNTLRGSGAVYFDSVVMFVFFLSVARYVEMAARHRSTGISDALSRLLPAIAHRLRRTDQGDQVEDVSAAQLEVGDRVLVRAGEVVPADGEVEDGGARIDESMLTGESVPVARIEGDAIAAGTINLAAPMRLRVSAVGAQTTLAGMVTLLTRAQAERPRIMRAADAFAGRFLIAVLAGAALVAAAWLLLNPARAFPATLAVLVAACPCALSLATLVVVATASAALARRGVLVARADAIESLAKVTRIVFDKTGTLTDGRVAVVGFSPSGRGEARSALRIAAALEAASEHPIGRAFVQAGGPAPLAAEVRSEAGRGIEGTIDGERYRIGTRAFVRGALAVGGPASAETADAARDQAILLGDRQGVLGAFELAETARPESREVVTQLREAGYEVEIASGDSAAAVRRLAHDCGIDRYASRQTPEAKLERIRALTAQGEFVAMVGDGVNDAPVLGGSGVSIAMGRGSALAQASAALILVGDSLRSLPQALLVARRAKAIIRQNLLWAVVYNLAAMPIAALGWVPPWLAAVGMSSSSILVVLNSLRVARSRSAG